MLPVVVKIWSVFFMRQAKHLVSHMPCGPDSRCFEVHLRPGPLSCCCSHSLCTVCAAPVLPHLSHTSSPFESQTICWLRAPLPPLLVQARPIPTAGPFVVHESDAPLTVPVDPHLATDSRAAERAGFDAEMADKMRRREVSRVLVGNRLAGYGKGLPVQQQMHDKLVWCEASNPQSTRAGPLVGQ